VAELEGVIIGTIQVCPSRPIGRLEFLCVLKDVPDRVRILAIKKLLVTGVETLKMNGAQLVSGLIPFELKSYKNFLKKRGAVTVSSGNLMIWRV